MNTAASVTYGFSNLTGTGAMLADNAKARETERRFSALIDGVAAGMDGAEGSATSSMVSDGMPGLSSRLQGDYIGSLAADSSNPADKNASLTGAAANAGQRGTVDKTSRLYEQSLELESLVVKIMLDSMKGTIVKSGMGGNTGFAAKMYEDMLYDQLARDMTKNSGFGLADQIYLQLKK